MNDPQFIPVLPESLHSFWPFIKTGLTDIHKIAPCDWLDEDIFSVIRTGNAECWIVERGRRRLGFFIAYIERRPYSGTPDYFIWIAWGLPLRDRKPEDRFAFALRSALKFVRDRAKQLNCEYVTAMSPRPGLMRYGFKPHMTRFRMSLT